MLTFNEELQVITAMIKEYKEELKSKTPFEQYALQSISFVCKYANIEEYLLNHTTRNNIIYVGLDRLSCSQFIFTIKDVREVDL